jgi:pimeloyl-ACP methyl ester carboxylesterase
VTCQRLVCLYGMTGGANSFLGLSGFLCEDFHLIMLDSQGHGKTEPLYNEEDYYFTSLGRGLKK